MNSRRRQGWTLVEVLVSTSILAILVVVLAEALNTTQRSWVTSRSAAERQQTTDSVSNLFSQQLRRATLQARPSYDSALNQLVPNSDLHFVCGPAAELLPAASGVCGDAVFFQRLAADGSLPNALQACGFFVQYGGDEAWRPTLLASAAPICRRFRLLQFHQPAGSLTLFQSSGIMGTPSRLSQFTMRSELYQWFSQPISDSSTFRDSVSVVAENVVAMIMQASPASQRCYDTRRHQWQAGSTDAALSRHQLPEMIEITLVMVEEVGWSRMAPERADAFAGEIMGFIKGQTWQTDAMQTSVKALERLLQTEGMTARTVVVLVSGGTSRQ